MTKIQIMAVAALLSIGMVISGIALAKGPSNRPQRGFAFHRPGDNQALMLLIRYQHQNIKSQALAELSGQSVETITEKLKSRGPHALMQELGIDRQALRSTTEAKINHLIKQAALNGTITAEQEKNIFEKAENRTKRRELMSRLIEKGIEDGTLTREEAQTLIPKQR